MLEDLPGFRADIDNSITAIKEALTQPAQEPDEWFEGWRVQDFHNACKKPAQEPVAWSVIGNGKFGEYKLGQTFVDYEATHIYWKNRGYELVPVYTTPPQRPWVGLTAEEILDLFDATNVYGSKWIEFARAVETKIKEKNNAA